jgi:hypothetical protein
MKGISGIPEGRKRATLYSLIQESIRLDSKEERHSRCSERNRLLNSKEINIPPNLKKLNSGGDLWQNRKWM